MTLLLAITSGLLGLVFLVLCGANYAIIIWPMITKKRGPSLYPIVGGIAGAVAMLIWPLHSMGRYAWIPLVLDPGFSLMVPALLRELEREYLRKRA